MKLPHDIRGQPENFVALLARQKIVGLTERDGVAFPVHQAFGAIRRADRFLDADVSRREAVLRELSTRRNVLQPSGE